MTRREAFRSMDRAAWWVWPAALLFVASLFWSLVASPDEVVLGSSVRIFYIHIGAAVATADLVVCAWGAWGGYLHRDAWVQALLRRLSLGPLWCLGVTAAGQPRHPLHLSRDQEPLPWDGGPG